MKIFNTGDYVKVTGDLIDDRRPESFIGMYGTIEFYHTPHEDHRTEYTEYHVMLEGLSDAQAEYIDGQGELPFFYEDELILVG